MSLVFHGRVHSIFLGGFCKSLASLLLGKGRSVSCPGVTVVNVRCARGAVQVVRGRRGGRGQAVRMGELG